MPQMNRQVLPESPTLGGPSPPGRPLAEAMKQRLGPET
jgi:hypothetical protein